MKDLTVFMPEKTSPCLPNGPIRIIGIDLGTTNSAVAEAVFDPENPHNIEVRCLEIDQPTDAGVHNNVTVPSVVALKGKGAIIGRGAKKLRARMTEKGLVRNKSIFYECKNEMGLRRRYNKAPEGFESPAEISGQILKFLFDSAMESNPAPIRQTVITVPASFQANQRNDTLIAAGLAGIDIEGSRFIDEPIAAFIDYVLSWSDKKLGKPGQSKNLLVFDFGGGTCDVAVFKIQLPENGGQLRVSSLAVSRYHRLGGGDIDLAILHGVIIPQIIDQNGLDEHDLTFDDKQRLLVPAFLSVAEDLKISLCMTIARLKQEGKYRDADRSQIYSLLPGVFPEGGKPLKTEDGKQISLRSPRLTAEQFEKVLEPFLDEDILYPREDQYRVTCSIFSPLEDAVDRSSLDKSDIDCVLLFGGSCLIPQVAQAVMRFFKDAEFLTFPDKTSIQTAVARGAAYQALALEVFGRGLVEPVCNETICIRTQNGLSELIPRGAPVPYPDKSNWAQNHTLVVPETRLDGSLPLRVEIVDCDERLIFRKNWNIDSFVNQGDTIVLEYRMDENQVLHLRMYLAEDGPLNVFDESVENPLTNVVNPEPKRLKILEIESELQNNFYIQRKERLSKLEMAADLYEELGDEEKALAVLKRVLKARHGKDYETLNKMGILCGSMGDHKRQEKFYRESARVSSSSAPLFNLALAQRERGETDKALKTVDQAIDRKKDAPYLVLKAKLAEDAKDGKSAKKCLDEAFNRFELIPELSDWELHWYISAAKMTKDDEKLKKAEEERKRRLSNKKDPAADGSVLPALKAGTLKRVA
ncbi:MAG: Hsp70 family protein [Deltaproteobacteria bacterium]|jgi:molecular chaperone DnaK